MCHNVIFSEHHCRSAKYIQSLLVSLAHRTPLHCAASCNDRPLCEFLVRNGAAVMAMTQSDGATSSQKCDPYAVGFEECESFLRGEAITHAAPHAHTPHTHTPYDNALLKVYYNRVNHHKMTPFDSCYIYWGSDLCICNR